MNNFYCPKCREEMKLTASEAHCASCGRSLILEKGVWVDSLVALEKDKVFYDDLYGTEQGSKWFQGLNRNFFKSILERTSLAYARERFFRKWLKGRDKLVLDLASGAGRDYFSKHGKVIGIDLSREALEIAKSRYSVALQSGATQLPFPDNTFDYVVSADFFGHVNAADKDVIIREINRVLRPDGLTLHIIETDSVNPWFVIAHSRPELFQKHFVEQIGGHIGLELPSVVVSRWKFNGFSVLRAVKIWGVVWPIRAYRDLFDNEYKDRSRVLRVVVALSRWCTAWKPLEVVVNIILNPVNFIIESLTPLDWGQGLMIACRKK